MDPHTRAFSIDGQTFEFAAALSSNVPLGGYVELEVDDRIRWLGQITARSVAGSGTARHFVGAGALLAPISAGSKARTTPRGAFASAGIAAASSAVVRDRVAAAWPGDAALDLGRMTGAAEAPARLHARGLARHTFMCGQSGSGKTYATGVVLEQLLVHTTLRMMVLDPNSDYVHLGRVDEAVPPDADGFSQRLATTRDDVFVFGTGHERNLGVNFGRLTLTQKATVLRVDPLQDTTEFAALLAILRDLGEEDYSLHDVVAAAERRADEGGTRLRHRIENLQLLDAEIWASAERPPIRHHLPDDWRALVLDLGSLALARDRSIMAASAITAVWELRHERNPLLLVIDEAHNICPSRPTDPDQAMATDLLVAMAGEGRKYGIHLLLATQRPQKLHENVLSQCDNLLLMRMNSAGDLAHLVDVFSHVPPDLIGQASRFGLGEGLAAGPISPEPLLYTTGTRFSPEGGSDVPTTWALRR